MILRNVHYFLLFLLLHLIAGGAVFAADKREAAANNGSGILFGQFMENEKTPLAKGRLFVYSDEMGPSAPNAMIRVPDDIVPLDDNGKFYLELPPGTYRLSASKMHEFGPMKPPKEGDPIYFKMDSTGKEVPFPVSAGSKTDAGVISTSRPMIRHYKGDTAIEGIVKDTDNLPVAGAVIYAYLNPGVIDKANYVSEKTSSDGKFVLTVNDGGVYYLRVRGEYGGGLPKEGEIVDQTSPQAVTAVTVNKGQHLGGVTIKVKRQQQRGPLFQGKPQPQPL